MARLTLAPARLTDVWAFGTNMRPDDAAEVMASDGYTPVEAVMESWAVSHEAWTARINGEVGAMLGVVAHRESTLLAPINLVWMLTTRVVDKYPVAFYKASYRVVRDLATRHGLLINYVDARYARALGWAERIGFKMSPPLALGTHGELFIPIVFGG